MRPPCGASAPRSWTVAPLGECDFVWDIAALLLLLLIADMLGFPPEAYDDLLRWWSDDLIRRLLAQPARRHRGQGTRGGSVPCAEFQLGVTADRRSKPPQDDLVNIRVTPRSTVRRSTTSRPSR